MQPALAHAVPVLGRDVVRQRILVGMHRDFGVARGARGEEHEHRVPPARGILGAVEVGAVKRVFLVEAAPARPLSPHQQLLLQRAALGLGQLHLVRHIPVCRADNGADSGGAEAVAEIVLLELIGGRDDHRPQLVQPEDGKPELIVPLEHQHHTVALFDSERLEIVCALRRGALHIIESEAPLGFILRHVQHGQLIRLAPGNGVHHVKGEIEAVLVAEGNGRGVAGLALGHRNKALADQPPGLCARGQQRIPDGGFVLVLAREHHRQEQAVRAPHGNHAVWRGAVVVNAVPLVQVLGVLAHLHLEPALQHQVKLLPRMAGQVNRPVLQRLAVGIPHPVGLGQLFAEERREVPDFNAVLPGSLLPLPPPGDGVGRKVRALPLQQVGDADAEGQRTFMDKGKGKIPGAALIKPVLLRADLGPPGHLLRRQARDLAHLPDALRDLRKLFGINCCHCILSFSNRKPASKETPLRRVYVHPRYHSNCGRTPPLLESNNSYALTQQSRETPTWGRQPPAFGFPARKGWV